MPNTLLNLDIRSIASSYNRIIAVYRKKQSTLYSKVDYKAKNIKLNEYNILEKYEYLLKAEDSIN